MSEKNKDVAKDSQKKAKGSNKERNQDTDLYQSHLPDFLFTPATPACLPPVNNEVIREEKPGAKDEE